jgi:hypothetical protein
MAKAHTANPAFTYTVVRTAANGRTREESPPVEKHPWLLLYASFRCW